MDNDARLALVIGLLLTGIGCVLSVTVPPPDWALALGLWLGGANVGLYCGYNSKARGPA